MKHRPEPSSSMGEEEEENFFVSLSDLMTGVLFIFVILTTALALHYHLKAGELEKAKGDTIGARAEAEKAKGAAEDAKGKARQVQEALDALAKVLREREQLRKVELQQLVARLREQNLAVELDGTNGILSLPEKLLFRTGEAKLQPDGEAALAFLAREILPVALKGCGNSPLKWDNGIGYNCRNGCIPESRPRRCRWRLGSVFLCYYGGESETAQQSKISG